MTGPHVLVVRLDSLGDVLVCGPAVRAIAAGAGRVTMLTGPTGAHAARLLPGVDDVMDWPCPWIAADPPPVDRGDIDGLVARLAGAEIDEALVLTSFHQSALPTALLLKMAGVGRVTAISDDYPGSLVDVRVPSPPDGPEPVRMLAVARAAGYALPPGDDGRLAVRRIPALPARLRPDEPFVVVHPGTSAPARAYPATGWRDVVLALRDQGWSVAVTGSPDETALTAAVAGGADQRAGVYDLGGRLTFAELGALLARATVLAVANTGPAHLAAAVGTPVVSLFSPVVPASRWRPYGVPQVLLGDQSAECRGTRARSCPIDGHPCLSRVSTDAVVAAVASLATSTTIPAPASAARTSMRGVS
jgi:ADP-heptose:LPS heptosyltransferase